MSLRKKIKFKLNLVLFVLLPQLAWAQGNQVDIVYSGNIDGELEPCGCSAEGDLGGILRQSSSIKKLRQQKPDLIALSSGGLIVSMVPQDKLTAEYILKAYSMLNFDAVGLQWNDLAYGDDFVLENKLNWVSTNRGGETFSAHRTVTRGDQKLSFFSWLDPASSPQMAMQIEHNGQVENDIDALTDNLRQAQKNGLTVLSTTLTLEQAKALPLQHVDMLFIRAAYEVFSEPQQIGNTLVLQPGSRGMRLGQLSLSLANDGRIADFEHEVISMPATVEDDPELLSWYEEYNSKVKQAYLKRVELRKSLETGQSPYVGEQVCKTCHQEEHEIWSETLHSNAFAKLEQVNKAFDPACIKCHTVGFEKQGGFIDFDATPHLMNVQCESCHGAGRVHVESTGFELTKNHDWQPEQICNQCHVQKHSPSFDLKSYWPRIKHSVMK